MEIMAFLPVWTCCFGKVHNHASNAEVEQHFSMNKGDKKPWQRFTEAEFIDARFKALQFDLNEIVC